MILLYKRKNSAYNPVLPPTTLNSDAHPQCKIHRTDVTNVDHYLKIHLLPYIARGDNLNVH